MQLTTTQKQEFREQGYLALPEIVPQSLVLRARRAINANLGEKGIDPVELPKYRSQTYCPDLTGDPAIADLYNATPLREITEQLVGAGQVRPINRGQIALRFPRPEDPADLRVRPHLDGMYSPMNGVQAGNIANFTALIGVFLSDIPEPNSGNFTVWPGTPSLYEKYFQEHGPQSLLNGMPDVELPTPVQITGKAGDAVLVHYQMAHGVAVNISANTRYAIFFRVNHIEHEKHQWSCMTDIWEEWSGMRDVV